MNFGEYVKLMLDEELEERCRKNHKELKFWNWSVIISTFLFIWLGWVFAPIRAPLLLTYVAIWFFGLCTNAANEAIRKEINEREINKQKEAE